MAPCPLKAEGLPLPGRVDLAEKVFASQTNHFYAAITAEKSQCLANLGRSFGAKTTVGGV